MISEYFQKVNNKFYTNEKAGLKPVSFFVVSLN